MNTTQQRETTVMGKFAGAIAACVMVVGFALPNASAATIESTTALSPPTIFAPGLTVDIGNSFDAVASGSTFIDHYTFTLGGAGLSVGSAISITLDFPGVADFSLDPFNAGMYTGGGTLLGIASVVGGEVGPPGSPIRHVLLVSALAAGDYDFRVQGLVAGADGGSYGGTLQVITAVPEPEVYAMLAAGLGLMGWVGRRRKQRIA